MATARSPSSCRKSSTQMGLDLEATAEEMPDGVRINLTGEDGNVLIRRQGEALAALQHIVAAIYRHETDRGPPPRRRLHGLSQGQGRRAEADGDVPRRARPRTPAWRRRSVRSIRTSAASSTSRSPSRIGDVGEHRRRVREDGHHFGEVDSVRSGITGSGMLVADRVQSRGARVCLNPEPDLECSPPPTPSSPSPRRRARRRLVSFASAGRTPRASPPSSSAAQPPFKPRHATFADVSRVPAPPTTLATRSIVTHVFPAPRSYTGEDVRRDFRARQSGCAGVDSPRGDRRRRAAGGAGRVHAARVPQRQARSGPGRGGRRSDRCRDAAAGARGVRSARRHADDGDRRDRDGRCSTSSRRLEASLDFPDEGYHFVAPRSERGARSPCVISGIDALLAHAARGRLVREGAQSWRRRRAERRQVEPVQCAAERQSRDRARRFLGRRGIC